MSKRDKDIAAIKKLAADWRSGWLDGNADLLVSLFADDPVLMPQDAPVVVGKEQIRSVYSSVLKEYRFTSKSRLVEVQVGGDWGYFWSTYSLMATPKAGGKAIQSAGKSVFIVRRDRDGAWRIWRLMDNRDGPPPAAG